MGIVVKQLQRRDVFVADFIDVAPKGEIGSMEHPIFALTKRADLKVFRYHNEKSGVWIEIAPSLFGRANIFDKDLLLYCTGQLVQGMNSGVQPKRKVRITAYDYLITTDRGTSGRDYQRLHDSLARLRGTTFKTNLNHDGGREVFGLIDEAELITDDKGRLAYIDVTLSRRIFDAIKNNQILTYNRKYFKLSPSERRTYELVRKHCGKQLKWEIGFEKLHAKFGTRASVKEFRRTVRTLVDQNRIPDYQLTFDQMREVLVAYYRPEEAA